jgi:hypothetical protein
MMNGVNGLTPVYVLPLKDVEMCDKCMQDKVACNGNHAQNIEDENVDPSLYGKIMQNLALATMMMNHRRSSLTQRNIEQMNLQMQQQNDLMTNLLMQQQAMQDHMTAVQMTTPGMGII